MDTRHWQVKNRRRTETYVEDFLLDGNNVDADDISIWNWFKANYDDFHRLIALFSSRCYDKNQTATRYSNYLPNNLSPIF